LLAIKARYRYESCSDFLVAKLSFLSNYPRSFRDPNGIGDLPGIITRMSYLFDLGVGAIWLSPSFPWPTADIGYDISNYVGRRSESRLDDFDTLVAAAHASNLKVILDLVPKA
jgi:alpha-glucosidase